jgi:hypothetical protein
MSVIEKEILKGYITCEDDATRNKFYNMLDSFWHKVEGKIIKSYTKDVEGTITGMTVLDKDGLYESVAFPVFPISQPISFIQELATELGKLEPKVAGKGLSSNDLTLELLNKLTSLNNYVHPAFHQIAEIENLPEALLAKADAPGEGYGFSQENFSLPEKQLLAAYNISHYGNPVNDLAELAQLTQAQISTKQRRYVHSEGVDYFYDATLATGDVAPADQVAATGFWMRGAAIVEVIDTLISTEAGKPLSANQGKVLKGFIDTINTLLLSDDTTLDEMQELVNFIKQNKTTLDTLGIANIAGLVDALAGKVATTGNEGIAGFKTFIETIINEKNLLLKYGALSGIPGYMRVGASDSKTFVVSNGLESLYLKFTNLTTARNFEFPDKAGTIALMSDLPALAPKTKPTKTINNDPQYTAILEDKDKFLVFTTAIDFIIPANIFAADDEISARNKAAGDVTVVDGAGMTVQVVSSQSKLVPQFGFFGLRFETTTVSGLLGQLKPI